MYTAIGRYIKGTVTSSNNKNTNNSNNKYSQCKELLYDFYFFIF
jgi:hypothetical protein